MTHRITNAEQAVLRRLADAWSAYLELPNMNDLGVVNDDINDFRKAVHDAQRIILARPTKRELNKKDG
ncbi:MAG: hypothetical protein WCY93_07810 [Anaerolineaceae bacterium]